MKAYDIIFFAMLLYWLGMVVLFDFWVFLAVTPIMFCYSGIMGTLNSYINYK